MLTMIWAAWTCYRTQTICWGQYYPSENWWTVKCQAFEVSCHLLSVRDPCKLYCTMLYELLMTIIIITSLPYKSNIFDILHTLTPCVHKCMQWGMCDIPLLMTPSTTYRYVHVLVQKMAVNVDLGFILALVDFFSLKSADAILEVWLASFVKRCTENINACAWELVLATLIWAFSIEYLHVCVNVIISHTDWVCDEWHRVCWQVSEGDTYPRGDTTFSSPNTYIIYFCPKLH